YRKLNIPPLGIVENMSHFVCPDCAHEADIFGRGGGEQMASDLSVPFLGRIPIYQPIREGGDTGVPLMISEPDSPAAQAFMAVAAAAKSLKATANLADARAAFGKLSEAIVAYVDAQKLGLPSRDPKIHIAYCPMANKPWLQAGEKIANPYYGSAMPTCGSLKK